MLLTKQLPVLRIRDASVSSTLLTDFNIGRHEEMGKPVLPTAHKHDFFLLLVVDEGAGVHKIDFEQYDVRDKMVFFLSAGQAHQWSLAEDTTGYQVMFTGDFLPMPPSKLPYFGTSCKPFLLLEAAEFILLSKELDQLKSELDNQELLARDMLKLRLQTILTLLQRWYMHANPPSINQSNNRMMTAFFNFLETHYHREAGVHFYAKQLNVTPNYLNIVCRKESGFSAGECIRQRILLEAKRLLAMTGKDISEISFGLGFEDPAYFSRFFKQHTGYTPRDFRKQL